MVRSWGNACQHRIGPAKCILSRDSRLTFIVEKLLLERNYIIQNIKVRGDRQFSRLLSERKPQPLFEAQKGFRA